MFGTTRTLPGIGCLAKLRNQGKRALVRDNKDPKGIIVPEHQRFCLDIRKFQNDNHICSPAPVRAAYMAERHRGKLHLSAKHMKAQIEFAEEHMKNSQTIRK